MEGVVEPVVLLRLMCSAGGEMRIRYVRMENATASE